MVDFIFFTRFIPVWLENSSNTKGWSNLAQRSRIEVFLEKYLDKFEAFKAFRSSNVSALIFFCVCLYGIIITFYFAMS